MMLVHHVLLMKQRLTIDQVKKCPEGTVIPSEQWTRLQFWPKNPRTKAAEYTQTSLIRMPQIRARTSYRAASSHATSQ